MNLLGRNELDRIEQPCSSVLVLIVELLQPILNPPSVTP